MWICFRNCASFLLGKQESNQKPSVRLTCELSRWVSQFGDFFFLRILFCLVSRSVGFVHGSRSFLRVENIRKNKQLMKTKTEECTHFFYTCFYTRQILTLKIERCCHLFLLDLRKQIPWGETRWVSLASTHLSESFTSSRVKVQLSKKDSFQRRQEFCINRHIPGRKWRHALEDPAQPSPAQRPAWRRMDVWCSATTRPTQRASWADDLITILRTTRSSTWNGIPITQVSCAPGSDHRHYILALPFMQFGIWQSRTSYCTQIEFIPTWPASPLLLITILHYICYTNTYLCSVYGAL